jgi:mRNA interferase MazF
MNYSRGDVILADLPYTDRSGSKVRPALVVQSDRNNRRLDDVIPALITSNAQRAAVEQTQLLIDVATSEGGQSGLLHISVVKCEHLVTLHRSFLTRAIGHLPDALMRGVNGCLKAALEIS